MSHLSVRTYLRFELAGVRGRERDWGPAVETKWAMEGGGWKEGRRNEFGMRAEGRREGEERRGRGRKRGRRKRGGEGGAGERERRGRGRGGEKREGL